MDFSDALKLMKQDATIRRAEDINVSYEEALKLAPLQLRKKIQHSVELIRKAEKIALKYDPENGFYNTFSGGKDSQALFHIVKMSGVKFQTHISYTSVDPAEVVRFVNTQYPSVIPIRPKKSIYTRAVERGILPTMRVRWCCADFKESAGAGKVTLIGIRKEESARRAKRHEVEVSRRKFSGNLYEFEQWSAVEIVRKQSRKSKRKINEDEFSVQSDNEVRCINGKDSILISPIFEWTEKDVWYFLDNIIKAPHCKLYDKGQHRIGCILCPMSQPKQKRMEIQRFPYVKEKWINAIKEIRKKHVIDECLGGVCKGNPYRKNIWTPIHKRAVLQFESMDSITPPQQEIRRKCERITGYPCVQWRRCRAIHGRRNSRGHL